MSTPYLHRYALFAPDGTGVMWGALAWEGGMATPVPPPISTGDQPALYLVSLEHPALLDHWYRLRAEAWALDPQGQAAGAQGHPRLLRHGGGTPHPQHPHIHLGGAVQWAQPPHPAVAAYCAELTARTPDALLHHLFGGSLV